MMMELFGQPREETKEEKLERTLNCYIKEMSAKEERIRQLKKQHAKDMEEMNHKYQILESKYKRLKSRRG